MKQIIKLEELPSSRRIQILKILDRNRVKKTRTKSKTKTTVLSSKYNLRSTSFGVTDYLKYITDKLKR